MDCQCNKAVGKGDRHPTCAEGKVILRKAGACKLQQKTTGKNCGNPSDPLNSFHEALAFDTGKPTNLRLISISVLATQSKQMSGPRNFGHILAETMATLTGRDQQVARSAFHRAYAPGLDRIALASQFADVSRIFPPNDECRTGYRSDIRRIRAPGTRADRQRLQGFPSHRRSRHSVASDD